MSGLLGGAGRGGPQGGASPAAAAASGLTAAARRRARGDEPLGRRGTTGGALDPGLDRDRGRHRGGRRGSHHGRRRGTAEAAAAAAAQRREGAAAPGDEVADAAARQRARLGGGGLGGRRRRRLAAGEAAAWTRGARARANGTSLWTAAAGVVATARVVAGAVLGRGRRARRRGTPDGHQEDQDQPRGAARAPR